jgi:UDP-2-acetamido-2,6-beta-L-arabino-hexul-4-ose reductase
MIKVGITGKGGFIGYHLYNTLNLFKDEFLLIEFDRSFFNEPLQLDSFVSSCDVIIHLAALNRHNDPLVIYETNSSLVKTLVSALERTSSKAHLIMSSTTQEERDNLYGRSKKDGRILLSDWANQNNGRLTGLIIPNVFGPFGHPFYNSVVASFCHQISRGESPIIDVDVDLKLIYVGELVEKIIRVIRNNDNTHELLIPHTKEAKVSDLFDKLIYFQNSYQEKGEIPNLQNEFEFNLFLKLLMHFQIHY